jgi:hypothetical protein
MERDEDTGRSPVDVFDETAFEQLVGLCSDSRSLWTAATPTEVDRKQILRTMIKDVRIEYRSEDIVRARIVWADDAPTTLVEACRTRNGEAKRLIRQMTTQGLSPAENCRPAERPRTTYTSRKHVDGIDGQAETSEVRPRCVGEVDRYRLTTSRLSARAVDRLVHVVGLVPFVAVKPKVVVYA